MWPSSSDEGEGALRLPSFRSGGRRARRRLALSEGGGAKADLDQNESASSGEQPNERLHATSWAAHTRREPKFVGLGAMTSSGAAGMGAASTATGFGELATGSAPSLRGRLGGKGASRPSENDENWRFFASLVADRLTADEQIAATPIDFAEWEALVSGIMDDQCPSRWLDSLRQMVAGRLASS